MNDALKTPNDCKKPQNWLFTRNLNGAYLIKMPICLPNYMKTQRGMSWKCHDNGISKFGSLKYQRD